MYLTPVIALVSLLIAAFTLMKTGWWPESKPVALVGWIGLLLVVVAVVLLLAVIAASWKRGPAWVRDTVDGWLQPADTKWYPDIKLLEVVTRVAPQFVTDITQGAVDYKSQEAAANTLREIGRLASLGKLQVFGQGQNRVTGAVDSGWTRIPEDFWRQGQLSYSDFIQNTSGKVSRRTGGEREEIYVNLQFDSRQIRKNFARHGATKKVSRDA